jgi:DNA-directed RNA polymerase subunit omega
MLDELKEDDIVTKVGGRFRLTTLIQKRMIALNQGARPLVKGLEDPMAVVIQEILQERIFLDDAGHLRMAVDSLTDDALEKTGGESPE